MKRRHEMELSFPGTAVRNNCQFLNVTDRFDSNGQADHPLLYVDRYHLGVEGHRRIGAELAEEIRGWG